MNSTIDINSTDEERTNILKDKMITIVAWDKSKEMIITNPKESLWQSLKKYARDNEIINKEIKFENFSFPLKFSMNTLKESVNQMTKRNANLMNFGKLLTVIDLVCENCIKIDVEEYRHENIQRIFVKQVNQYLSAFYDNEKLYPVKITIKEMKNNANQLYLIISVGEIKLSEIKKEALTITNMHSEKSEESSSDGVTSFVKVNITDFIELFNRSESIIIKNLPDGLLKPEQIKIKEKVMKHDEMKENKFINMLFSKVL